MSRLARAVAAAMGLAVLGGGTALPLLAPVPGEETSSYCCRGRCCCTGEATNERTAGACLRVSCGCGSPEGALIPASLRLEAVLTAVPRPAVAEPRRLERSSPPAAPLERPHAPPVPPPRRRPRA